MFTVTCKLHFNYVKSCTNQNNVTESSDKSFIIMIFSAEQDEGFDSIEARHTQPGDNCIREVKRM